MHELSVCQALMDQVEKIASERQARKVVRIELEIGALSGVEPELLRQSFPIASAGTLAENCQLEISQPPIQVRCESCGATTDATANRLICGNCGDWHTTLVSGDALLLRSLELDT